MGAGGMAMGAFGKDFGDGAGSLTKFKERWIEKINKDKDKVFYASAALVRAVQPTHILNDRPPAPFYGFTRASTVETEPTAMGFMGVGSNRSWPMRRSGWGRWWGRSGCQT